MFYNMTLAPNMIYTTLTKPMEKDKNLLSLKVAMDNAILEYKA